VQPRRRAILFGHVHHRIHRAPSMGYRREANWTAVVKASSNGLQTRPRGESL
jgi:hypothetical protein